MCYPRDEKSLELFWKKYDRFLLETLQNCPLMFKKKSNICATKNPEKKINKTIFFLTGTLFDHMVSPAWSELFF